MCTNGIFYALDVHTGKLKWTFITEGEKVYDAWDYYSSSPAVSKGIVYFGCGEAQFHATVSGNTVFFCSRDYNVYPLNIRDGGGHWVYHGPASLTSVPSLSNNRLVVTMSDSHSILPFDKNNGLKLYETPVPLNVFSSASLNDTAAYFGSMDGAVYKPDIYWERFP